MLVHADEVFVAQVSCSERITFFVETLLASHLIETSERRRRDRPRPSELDRYETSTARQAAATDKRGWKVGTTVTTEPPSPRTLNSLSKSTHTQIGSLQLSAALFRSSYGFTSSVLHSLLHAPCTRHVERAVALPSSRSRGTLYAKDALLVRTMAQREPTDSCLLCGSRTTRIGAASASRRCPRPSHRPGP